MVQIGEQLLRKLILLLALLMIPLVSAIDQCYSPIETEDIPCLVVSTWNYTTPCSSHQATVYNSLGNNTANFTFGNYGSTGLCLFTWNVTARDSYTFTVGNGDTGSIIIQVDNLQIGLVLAIIGMIGVMLYLAFKLEETQHGILKLTLIFFSVILLGVIPTVFLVDDLSGTLHKLMMGFTVVFWLYVAGYLIYMALVWLGVIIPKTK